MCSEKPYDNTEIILKFLFARQQAGPTIIKHIQRKRRKKSSSPSKAY